MAGAMLLILALACAPESDTPLCPAWSGFTAEGRSWEYEAFGDDSVSVTTLDTLGLDRVSASGDGWRDDYHCDADGLWIDRGEVVTDALEATWTYDPPGLVLPAVLEPGLAWTAAWAWQYADTTGEVRVESSDVQFEVVAAGRSNVAAGAFDTLEVRVQDGSASDTRYYALDVGLVLDDRQQLAALHD